MRGHVPVQEEDMLELLMTRGGAYDMACALDYDLGTFYDVWVARDIMVRRGCPLRVCCTAAATVHGGTGGRRATR